MSCLFLFIMVLTLTLKLSIANDGNAMQTLLPNDKSQNDYFGRSVAIHDNYALISNIQGIVYVFQLQDTQWRQTDKLTINDSYGYSSFGIDISIYNNVALIGSLQKAYVFELKNSKWAQTATLVPDDALAPVSSFGSSVSIYDKYALVGGYAFDDEKAAAYVFELKNGHWTQKAKLIANDSWAYYFGVDVSIYKNHIFIGSQGAVYVFELENDEWIRKNTLDGFMAFGSRVAIHNNSALVSSAQSVDVFELKDGEWIQKAKLVNYDHGFGESIAVYNNYALIGAIDDTSTVYVFELKNEKWKQKTKLMAPAQIVSKDFAYFGSSLSIYNSSAVVGCDGCNKAYIFQLNQLNGANQIKISVFSTLFCCVLLISSL
eukprot:197521_1